MLEKGRKGEGRQQ